MCQATAYTMRKSLAAVSDVKCLYLASFVWLRFMYPLSRPCALAGDWRALRPPPRSGRVHLRKFLS